MNSASDSNADDSRTPPPRRRLRLSALALGMLLGAGAALAVGVVLLMLLARDAPPLLTQEAYDAARQQWRQQGPESYNLEVLVGGRQSGLIRLEVRQGEATAMTRDGVVPSRRVWEYWTVPEQFEMIHRELTADPQTAFGVPDRSQVILRAEFDPRFGFPRKYQREILGQDQPIRWEVTRFEPMPPEGGPR